ncbi:hypothetical protein LEP1GSC034_0289 [Leptospira interrogans str. 2003000735]|uniref:Uncharacterized protein n=5 Tax=Leptospira interrogans TaxID=173 RepID=A0A829CTF4_LEPIR|nr:hypothetical protein LEP1GSC080_2518 [Leptospira interrogans str. FPW2026]EKO22751.1 hypothetical protein LEP1GSC104_1573 [Leptospira interrogans str. UI 12621]EKO88544.1 hypothetical protein LEP1GSC009_1090 [Leptospira interrogans serovar Grippotyphosa str. Andaman]EKP22399.1 hypothetical protein LEP1GSC117_3956 [Leptospira interrogans serovar Icterohaemorrhagiae str. Verdun LP]EKP76984.1 hypothetical protein LEP1GSC173_0540 [Leptospira interrogans str. HAI1594]EKP84253.1 hypothetical prot
MKNSEELEQKARSSQQQDFVQIFYAEFTGWMCKRLDCFLLI